MHKRLGVSGFAALVADGVPVPFGVPPPDRWIEPKLEGALAHPELKPAITVYAGSRVSARRSLGI